MMEPDIRCEWRAAFDGPCGVQATWLLRVAIMEPWTVPVCDSCLTKARRLEPERATWQPICRDPRPVAIFCGALAGAIPPDARDVIADYVAHDRLGQADPSPLLDLAEQRGLHEGGYGPERYEEWPEATEHVHVWLAFRGDLGGPVYVSTTIRNGRLTHGAPMRRCPCGVFEHEAQFRNHWTSDHPLPRREPVEWRREYLGQWVDHPDD